MQQIFDDPIFGIVGTSEDWAFPRYRKFRLEQQVTLVAMAAEIGHHPSYVGQLERGWGVSRTSEFITKYQQALLKLSGAPNRLLEE